MQVRRRLAAQLSVLALAALCAFPAVSGAWTRMSEHTGANFDEAGMVRGADGTLHIVYKDDVAFADQGLRYRTMTPSGVLGAPQSVLSGWVSRTNPDIELLGGVPHVFFGGQQDTNTFNPFSSGQAWTANPASGTWAVSPTPMSATTTAYASTQVSSVEVSETEPWISFSGTAGAFVHAGFATAGAEANYQPAGGCCAYGTNLGRNPVTGEVTFFYKSNATGEEGYYRRTIAPTLGAPALLPRRAGDTASLERGARLAATPRTTTGEVYTAYCATYPTCSLLRIAGASSYLGLALPAASVPTTPDSVWTSAAPAGRMWLSWSNRSGVFAVRTNKALTKWGPIQRIALPLKTDTSWNTSGDGARGPLDLFTNLTDTANGTYLWTQRILPPLTLTPVPTRVLNSAKHTVRFRLTDAGDPVAAGKVRFRGVTATTNFAGYATFVVPAGVRAGFYPATGAVVGYRPATSALRVLAPLAR